MRRRAPAQPSTAGAPRLFLTWQDGAGRARRLRAAALSLAAHAAALALLSMSPAGQTALETGEALAQLREPVRLVAPSLEITQADPNRGRVGREFTLDSLRPRPKVFIPPSLPPGAPPQGRPVPVPAAPPLGELPKFDAPAFARGSQALPPPEIHAEEPPKLAFETPKLAAPQGAPTGRLPMPGATVSEMRPDTGRSRGSGGLVVSDYGEGLGGSGPGVQGGAAPAPTGSSLELLSDPHGVDFRSYLAQVLASVRRNWLAIIPESARLGARGRVVIQFSVSRDGSIPKLVIASSSGMDALDRAAVAGISASTPLPPLPDGYSGLDIRLQFVFLYNMKPY